MSGALAGLYYPFSRPIDVPSLKQMLLIFESLTFLDPVDEEEWRAKLFRDLKVYEDHRFGTYHEVSRELPVLFAEGATRRVDPALVRSIEDPLTTASVLSDLADESWLSVASKPQRYGMPHRNLGPDGAPTWQIFRPKMPTEFVDILRTAPDFHRHLVHEGHAFQSWTVSYAAGSAITLNVHMAAAEELNLTPVSDSSMHHELLLRKLARFINAEGRPRPLPQEVVRQLTHSTATALVDRLLPREALEKVTFDQILRFRESTRDLRREAMHEIGQRFGVLSRFPETEHLLMASREIQHELGNELRQFRAEIGSIRDRLWPTLLSSTNVTTSGVAAVAFNYIGGPAYALLASVLASSLALLKSTLDLRAEKRKIEASQAPPAAYLACIESLR